jgi:N-acyl-D-amino-acid deacylase
MSINMRKLLSLMLILALPVMAVAQMQRRTKSTPRSFDVIIKGGAVYDGTGRPPVRADVGINRDRIAAIGNLSSATAPMIIDARGLAVAPGFINMLSHSESSLIADGRSLGEIKQGVTTQLFGELSMGPLNDQMKRRLRESQGDLKYEIEWTTLAEFLTYLEKRGISQNVASFIGAPTIREYVIGLEDKPPTPAQLEEMRELVRREMEAGALGITTALIYPPAFFAKTDELIELCQVAAKYKGKYTTHMRSEGNQLIEGVQETIRISREAGLPAEIYHLKASGEANWPKMDPGSPDRILLASFKTEKLKPLTGKTLAECSPT